MIEENILLHTHRHTCAYPSLTSAHPSPHMEGVVRFEFTAINGSWHRVNVPCMLAVIKMTTPSLVPS